MIILYLQIGMFQRTLHFLTNLFFLNTSQIYSLDLILYRLSNVYLDFKSWGTCKFFLIVDSEKEQYCTKK